MNRMLIVTFMVAAWAGGAAAEEIRNRMEFPNDRGDVVFYHGNHVNEVKGDCTVCHANAPGKIEGFGKEYAHKTCIPCHEPREGYPEGPVKCEGCHKMN